jgi:hypothetical protein
MRGERDLPRGRCPSRSGQLSGYLHPGYAHALAEFGVPRGLIRSGSWILEREVPGSVARDAMGCYPLFVCQDWAGLPADLADIGEGLISLCVVPDPLSAPDTTPLRACFPDLVQPFKSHLVADLRRPMRSFVSAHHRSRASRALRQVVVLPCPDPAQFLGIWSDLYQGLVDRRGIRGLQRFSRRAFAGQLAVPGLFMFRAEHHDEVVGIALWYVQGEAAYYHLSACSDVGYQLGAAYALFWHSIEFLQGWGASLLDLGASAGLTDVNDGLHRFKRGWASDQRTAFLCGRIFDRGRYETITAAAGRSGAAYFPAYRAGEFGEPGRPATAAEPGSQSRLTIGRGGRGHD